MPQCANFHRSALAYERDSAMQTSGQGPTQSVRRATTKLLELMGKQPARLITREQVRRLEALVSESLDSRGRAPQAVAAELQRIEREGRFTRRARAAFQTLLGTLGLDSTWPLELPVSSQPYWSHYEHPLKHYRSSPRLPAEADVVIIGAGLTGSSAAYHLRGAVAQGRRVIVLDRGQPAGEASGRNAGHFELLPENSVGTYDGLSRERLNFLRRCYPQIPREVLRLEAERQASLLLSFAIRNRDRLKQIISQESIACDFSPKGWLYLAHSEREEQAVCDEVALASSQEQQVEIWSRMKIRQEFGFERDFLGRFIPDDGTYHPAKFVYGVLQVAIKAGVELYTHVPVVRVRAEVSGCREIETPEGTLLARSVIVATNAFTRQLFPELSAIAPAQSQIAVTEFAPDRCRGRVVTAESGPVYFNQPRAGARDGLAPLLLGGGKDRRMRNPSSRRRSPQVHRLLVQLRDRYFPELQRRPFSAEWIGPIAVTPDQLPAMGLLQRGIVVAAGFNGYGGSYCVAAGQAAAEMAITGTVPDWLPEDVFSPQRFLKTTPLFFAETSNLWCYAASLCVQLRAANRQLLEAAQNSSRPPRDRITGQPFSSTVAAGQDRLAAESLQALKPFREFSAEECADILAISRTRRARKNEVLFQENSPGEACYVLVEGAAEVSIGMQEGRKVLARLGPSAIFGQIALLDGGRREATCIVRRDALLLELAHDRCYGLLVRHSPLAYKFLAALTEPVIQALRAAERQLEQLNGKRKARVVQSARARKKSAGA